MLPIHETALLTLCLVGFASYLLGSVPFGIVVARLMGLGDLRSVGPGTIGATNVLRTGNKTAAFLTLVFDAGKGAVAVLLAAYCIGGEAAQIAGLFAFLGHLFPVWLKFQGGKGVATFLGILLSLSFIAGFATCMTWLAVAVVLRFSSLAALVAAASTPFWAKLFGVPEIAGLATLLAVLIWVRHKDNIKRLMAGTETKIGAKKTDV